MAQHRPHDPADDQPNELIDDQPEDAHLESEYEDRPSPWDADINPYDGGLLTDDPDFVRDSFDDGA